MDIQKLTEITARYKKQVENNKFNLETFGKHDESYKFEITYILENNITILECLEKQIPVKLIQMDFDEYICICGNVIKDKTLYCSHCGQKLEYNV
jgi:hypothetical protein